MAIEPLPIFCYYDKQRFTQFGCMDCANWYGVQAPTGKKGQALYPAMGRKHINFMGTNRLIFTSEPRQEFKSIDFAYIIVGTQVIQVDKYYNERIIGNVALGTNVWFDYLPVGTTVYCMLTDERNAYLITENGNSVTYQQVTDPNAPVRPTYVCAFGDRFAVSSGDTPDYFLTQVNVGTASNCFTINGAPLFNRASGIIRQMASLHKQLYIFSDFQTDVLANIPTQITVAGQTFSFPWKVNTSYDWDYGIADPFSLSTDFGRMVFLAQNRNGLVSFMATQGQQPQDISSQAINVLLENSRASSGESPFLTGEADGFLYQYENTIFYRVSAGPYLKFGELDRNDSANAIEYNFTTQTWARVIELNGERNRIQKHIFFNNTHLVTVSGDPAIYEMAGNIYVNELRNLGTDPQAPNAFITYPMRYVLQTQQIFEDDYSEFMTDYVEIDFVFGEKTFYKSDAPFDNTVYIITEESDPCCPTYVVAEESTPGNPIFIIAEEGNTEGLNDDHYNKLFKPHIELFYSNDGGVTNYPADLREFSQLGQSQWRMRWYELGESRNRSYRLVCVSSAPIVILGAVQSRERISGGAN